METFVLVHGSFHDGNAWKSVISHLESKGHQAFAPTMIGHGKGADRRVNHAQCTQSIVDYILEKDLSGIILLGHSFGGTVIAKVAEAIPERIKRLIFYCSLVLNDGESVYDVCPPALRAFIDASASSPDFTLTLPFFSWRERYINDADLEFAQTSYEMLSPEPCQPFLDKLNLKLFYSLKIPKSYLNCTEDTVFPPGEWALHPRLSSRLGLYRLVQMPGSHEVLLTNPEGLAQKIIEAGRD